MSASVVSKYACSRASRCWPSGVANHAAIVPVDTLAGAVEDASMPTIIPIPAFADNYIWLLREGRAAAVVDAGDAAPVIDYLDREQVELTAIICTHHHGDHGGGNRALLERWQVPVYGPASETIRARTRCARTTRSSFRVSGSCCRFSIFPATPPAISPTSRSPMPHRWSFAAT